MRGRAAATEGHTTHRSADAALACSARRPAPDRPPVGRLPLAARAFRMTHATIAVGFLGAIGEVWWSALTGRRGRSLRLAVVALVGEAAAVALNHGDCPLGPLQRRVGDPVPLFELVLSPDAARRAVPALGLAATAGIALAAVRGPAGAR
jgi:hypothetical protein